MKRAIFVLLILIFILTGCSRNDIERNSYSRFKTVESYKDCVIIVDKDTGIAYFVKADKMSPVYDSNGELYRPNGWRDGE